MTLEQVREILAAHRTELTELGVGSLSVYGSTARGEAGPESDVDLLVELSRPMGLFGFFTIQERLEQLLNCPVDLAEASALRPRVRERILKEAVVAA